MFRCDMSGPLRLVFLPIAPRNGLLPLYGVAETGKIQLLVAL